MKKTKTKFHNKKEVSNGVSYAMAKKRFSKKDIVQMQNAIKNLAYRLSYDDGASQKEDVWSVLLLKQYSFMKEDLPDNIAIIIMFAIVTGGIYLTVTLMCI